MNHLSEVERKQYIRHLENLSLKASLAESMKIDEEDRKKKELEEARKEERELMRNEFEKAKLEEAKQKSIEIARNALKENIDLETIKKITGLSEEEIKNIK